MNLKRKVNEMYAVMKFFETVDVKNGLTGEYESVNIEGIDGFIPVFKSKKDADSASCDGKYDVMQIQPTTKQDTQ